MNTIQTCPNCGGLVAGTGFHICQVRSLPDLPATPAPDPVLSAVTELRDCIRGLTAIVEELCSLLSDRKACGVRSGETCEDCMDSCECGDVNVHTCTGDDPNLRIRCTLRPGHDGAHSGGERIWPRLA